MGSLGRTWHWVVSLILWPLFIFMIVVLSLRLELIYVLFSTIFTGIAYFTYIATIFSSKTCGYVWNVIREGDIASYMQKMYQSPIEIKIVAKAYHKSLQSQKSGTSKIVTVYTDSQSDIFHYSYCRDVSGTITVDLHENNEEAKKPFIKLTLPLEYALADNASREENHKLWVKIENSLKKDRSTERIDELKVDNHHRELIIRAGEGDPWFIARGWLIFFNIIMLGQIYKIYVRSYCRKMSFTLVKLVSTKECLEEVEKKYIGREPCILHNGRTINVEHTLVREKRETDPGFCFGEGGQRV